MKNFYHTFEMWVGSEQCKENKLFNIDKVLALFGVAISFSFLLLAIMIGSSLSLLFFGVLFGFVAVLIFSIKRYNFLWIIILMLLYQLLGIGSDHFYNSPTATLAIAFNLIVFQFLLVKNLSAHWKASFILPLFVVLYSYYRLDADSSTTAFYSASFFPAIAKINLSYIPLLLSTIGLFFILFKQQGLEMQALRSKLVRLQQKEDGRMVDERLGDEEKKELESENENQNDLLIQKEIELRKLTDELERTKTALKKALLDSEKVHEQVDFLMEEAHLNSEIFQAQEDVIKANFDIQKHTKEQIKEAVNEHHKFSAMVEHSSDLIALFDFQGNFLYVNLNGRKLLGVPEDISCIDHQVASYVSQNQQEILQKEIPFQLDNHGRWSGELVLVNQVDHTELTMDASVFTVYDKHTYEPICYATVQRDITEKKRVAEQVNLLSLVASKTNNSVIITDADGKIQWVNNAFSLITGYTMEEVTGKRTFDFLNSKENVKKDFKKLLKRLKSKKGFATEMMNYRKSGESYWAEINVTPLLNAQGEIEKYIAIESDITHRKNTEQILKSTLSDLQSAQSQLVQSEKMASLGQLSAGIAHEINNPINFVYAGTETLKFSMDEFMQIMDKYCELDETNDVGSLKEEILELKDELDFEELKTDIFGLIKDIMVGAVRTSEIVKGLRNFSRLDEDNMKLANIHDGLDSTLILLKNQVKNRVQIHKNYGDVKELYCYPGQLNQVFMNILTNAIQAVEGEGNIWISTSIIDSETLISIKDDGKGMSQEVMAKIFEPFFTTKEVGEGTGLGMSISYGIIQKHRGQIEVKSQEGIGSEFIIHLPIGMEKSSAAGIESTAFPI